MIGKFENEEVLLKSYGDLEKEFTKKCQELSRVKKELEDARQGFGEMQTDEIQKTDLIESEITSQPVEEVVEDAELTMNLLEEEKCEQEVETDEVSQTDEWASGTNDSVQFDKLGFRLKANEFLAENSEARAYTKEIAKVLLSDKSLLSCADPFKVAYALVLKDKSSVLADVHPIKEGEMEKSDSRDNEELKKINPSVSLLGRKTSTVAPIRVVQKYRTMDDARAELMRRFS